MAKSEASEPQEAASYKVYTAEQWEEKREIITQMLDPENRATHLEVLRMLATEHDFHPNLAMFKRRIRKWQLYKKNNESDIRTAIHLGLQRQSQHKFRTEYNIRGRRVSHGTIVRYLRRKGIHDLHNFAATARVSACPSSSAPVAAYTPSQSPEPWGSPFTIPPHEPLDELDFEQDDFDGGSSVGYPSTALVLAKNPLASIPPLLPDCSDLQLFRETLVFNKEYFDYLRVNASLYRESNTPGASHEFFEPPELRTFVAELWRGRDLLLEHRDNEAFEHFNEAFRAVKPALERPSRKFLPELYEMALNNQLDESTGIVSMLLGYVAQMACVKSGTHHLNQSIHNIAKRLHEMTAEDRADAAGRLLSNVSLRFSSDLAVDKRDVLTINKTLSRSQFCRYPLERAIKEWKPRLEAEKRSTRTPEYEDCVLIFELAKCYRLLNKLDDAIAWINVALSKALRLENVHSQADIKVRCFRALGWVEVKRDNGAIAYSHLAQAYGLAMEVLGREDSLTHLVESDLAEIEVMVFGARVNACD